MRTDVVASLLHTADWLIDLPDGGSDYCQEARLFGRGLAQADRGPIDGIDLSISRLHACVAANASKGDRVACGHVSLHTCMPCKDFASTTTASAYIWQPAAVEPYTPACKYARIQLRLLERPGRQHRTTQPYMHASVSLASYPTVPTEAGCWGIWIGTVTTDVWC
jgi:hypothetical protein